MDRANYLNDGTLNRDQYPMSTSGLDFMQKQALMIHDAVAAVAGSSLLILQGCTENNNYVSEGLLCVNGEILPFVAGQKQTKVRIIEAVSSITADYIEYRNCEVRRHVEFGSNAGGTEYTWADFQRLKSNKELEEEKATKDEVEELRALIMPTGVIAMWSGTIQTIPTGWALCDGSNGTPDLRDRFVVAAGRKYEATVSKGGVETVTLTKANIPPHSHNFSWSSYSNSSNESDGSRIVRGNSNQKDASKATDTNTSELKGESFSIMPPYYALAFIMKL